MKILHWYRSLMHDTPFIQNMYPCIDIHCIQHFHYLNSTACIYPSLFSYKSTVNLQFLQSTCSLVTLQINVTAEVFGNLPNTELCYLLHA